METSASTFLEESKHKYASGQCSSCGYKSEHALLILFRFDVKPYDYIRFKHSSLVPADTFTIQDGRLVCFRCCGFSLGKPTLYKRMQNHHYTWIDKSTSYCSVLR